MLALVLKGGTGLGYSDALSGVLEPKSSVLEKSEFIFRKFESSNTG